MFRAPGSTVNEKAFDTLVEELSVTCTVKLDKPDVVVVPLIIPEEDKDKPVGSEPESNDQLYGNVPPLAWSVSEYAVPAVAFGHGDVEVICKGESEPFVKLFRCPVESVMFIFKSATYAFTFVIGLPPEFFHIIFAD